MCIENMERDLQIGYIGDIVALQIALEESNGIEGLLTIKNITGKRGINHESVDRHIARLNRDVFSGVVFDING